MRDFKRYVLFVCGSNSARSQMAEGFLREMGSEWFITTSAGFEPTKVSEDAVKVMSEIGIDISGATTDNIFELFKKGKQYNFIITVCDDETAEQCPLFPGISRRIHWNILNPYTSAKTEEERLELLRKVRDEIKEKIKEFIDYWTIHGR